MTLPAFATSEIALALIVMLLFETQNLFSFITRFSLKPAEEASDDYTFVNPVYGHRRLFDDRSHIERFKARVLVALDMAGVGMGELADELEADGWAVHRTRFEIPGPPNLVLDAIRAGAVHTRYVFRLDADTVPVDDPGPYVRAMELDGTDFASVRVYVENDDTFVGKMQASEYRVAMRARRLRPWLSSGACFGGTAEAMSTVLESHSLWFPGEDLESGRIAQTNRMRVRHLDLRVVTDAPETWRALFKQRTSWWAGGFRHAVVNADKNLLHTPMVSIYNLGLVTLGFFLKLHAHVVSEPASVVRSIVLLMVIYTGLTFLVNWQVRSRWLLLYAPYALVQSMCMPLVGAIYWAKGAWRQQHSGRYRFGYRRGSRTCLTTGPVSGAPSRYRRWFWAAQRWLGEMWPPRVPTPATDRA